VYSLRNPASPREVATPGSGRPLDRTSSGEKAVSLVSGDPLGEIPSFVEQGLLNPRDELLALITRERTGEGNNVKLLSLQQ
jgi:hypothetical protein